MQHQQLYRVYLRDIAQHADGIYIERERERESEREREILLQKIILIPEIAPGVYIIMKEDSETVPGIHIRMCNRRSCKHTVHFSF